MRNVIDGRTDRQTDDIMKWCQNRLKVTFLKGCMHWGRWKPGTVKRGTGKLSTPSPAFSVAPVYFDSSELISQENQQTQSRRLCLVKRTIVTLPSIQRDICSVIGIREESIETDVLTLNRHSVNTGRWIVCCAWSKWSYHRYMKSGRVAHNPAPPAGMHAWMNWTGTRPSYSA